MWVVDLNRQSLDRVVPDIAAGPARRDVRGRRLALRDGQVRAAARRATPALRERIDAMPNEEYQRLLRADAGELRERLEVDVDDLDDDELLATFRDLGGHDLGALLDGYRQADAVRDRPSVVFAYTIKGWRLPTEGHPANHSALLNDEQYARARGGARRRPGRPVGAVRRRLAGGRAVRGARRGGCARAGRAPPAAPPAVPDRPRPRAHAARASTQQAFGRFFVDLVREAPEVAERVVTVSPDVGTSTNLGGWINKAGHLVRSATASTGSPTTPTRSCAGARPTTASTSSSASPRSTSSALLGELGATWSRDGQPLLPVGTIYDPFVARALEPWSFGIYAGGQSILVGTPSGVTLGPEGGAHQSVITPSIGIEQPGCVAWEPAFGQDLEWAFLHALSPARPRGRRRAPTSGSRRARSTSRCTRGTREEVLARRLPAARRRRRRSVVIAVMGALVPEAIEAADMLREEAGIDAEVVCITSADLLFRSFQARAGLGDGDPATLDRLFPHEAPDRHAARRPPAHARVPRRGADRLPRRAALRPVRRHRRALRAPRDRRRVGRRRGARPDGRMSFTTRPELRGTFGMVASTHWLASAVGHVGARARRQRVRRRGRGRLRAAGRRAAPQRAGRRRAGDLLLRGADEVRVLCGQGPAPARGDDRRATASAGSTSSRAPGPLAACVPGAFDAWMLMLRDFGTWELARRAGAGDRLRARRLSGRAGDRGRDRRRGGAAAAGVAERRPSSSCPAPQRGRAVPQPRAGRRLRAARARPRPRARAARRRSTPRATPSTAAGWPRRSTSSSPPTDGLLTGADLARLAGDARGAGHARLPRAHVCKTGPWGQGPVLLQQLALLEGFDLAAMGPGRLRPHRDRVREARVRRPRGVVRRPGRSPTCRSTRC